RPVDYQGRLGRAAMVGNEVDAPRSRWVDRNRHRGHARLGPAAIDRLVRERIGAEVSGSRRVGKGPGLAIERERAVGRTADQHGLEGILVAWDAVVVVWISVVGQDVAADGRVLVGGGGVVRCDRSIVDLPHRQADRGYARLAPAAVPRF